MRTLGPRHPELSMFIPVHPTWVWDLSQPCPKHVMDQLEIIIPGRVEKKNMIEKQQPVSNWEMLQKGCNTSVTVSRSCAITCIQCLHQNLRAEEMKNGPVPLQVSVVQLPHCTVRIHTAILTLTCVLWRRRNPSKVLLDCPVDSFAPRRCFISRRWGILMHQRPRIQN